MLRFGAQRHAHPNLAGAPLHCVCGDAVQTHRSEHQRQHTKQPRHLRDRALLIKSAVHLLLHGLNINEGQIGIDFAEHFADERFHPHRRFPATAAPRR